MSVITGSTARTPWTVLISTGKNAPSATTVTFMPAPRPRSSISTGTSAGLGIGRSSSVTGSNRR